MATSAKTKPEVPSADLPRRHSCRRACYLSYPHGDSVRLETRQVLQRGEMIQELCTKTKTLYPDSVTLLRSQAKVMASDNENGRLASVTVNTSPSAINSPRVLSKFGLVAFSSCGGAWRYKFFPSTENDGRLI